MIDSGGFSGQFSFEVADLTIRLGAQSHTQYVVWKSYGELGGGESIHRHEYLQCNSSTLHVILVLVSVYENVTSRRGYGPDPGSGA